MSDNQYRSETRDFHPLVADWLVKHGYSFTHEYRMPDTGRVDFYATKPQGNEILLVEAELWSDIGSGLMQLVHYRTQIPDAKVMLAAPLVKIADKHRDIAKKYDIQIVTFDIGKKPKREKDGIDMMIASYLELREAYWNTDEAADIALNIISRQNFIIQQQNQMIERLLTVANELVKG